MPQGRRVRRVIRKIDPWTVFKFNVLFLLSVSIVFVMAGVILWVAGSSAGVIDDAESWFEGFGWDTFEFNGPQMLRGSIGAGVALVVFGSFGSVVLCLLYNLISDVVGGIELTVLEEIPDATALSAASQNGDETTSEGRVTSASQDSGTEHDAAVHEEAHATLEPAPATPPDDGAIAQSVRAQH